jgi:serine/threonine protein kinase
MEYVDGITLAEWLATNPSHSARQRVMLQLLDALEYIHSLQLVHHDLKSSNILITRNGQNVKLIDFGLSELDTTNPQNDIQHDIQKFGEILQLLFPSRYKSLRQQCQNGRFANMAAIRLSIEKRQRRQKYIPYIIAIIILTISALLSIHTYRLYQESEQMAQVANEYAQKQQREQEMIEQIYRLIDKEIEQLQSVADKSTSYFSYTQHPLYMGIWALQAQVRDSLANCYADNPDLKHKCIEIWVQEFGTRVMQIDSQVKQSKPIH